MDFADESWRWRPSTPAATAGPLDVNASAQRTELMPGLWGAPVGRRLEFALDAALHATPPENGAPAGQGGAVELRYKGTLQLDVVGRSAEGIDTKVRFPGLAIETARGDAATLRRQKAVAADGCLVHFRPNGQIVAYTFPPAVNAQERSLLRTLIAPFAFAAERDDTASWSSVEADNIGTFEVDYQRRSNDDCVLEVERHKRRYAALALDLAPVEEPVLAARAVGRIDRSIGWLRSATVHEELTLRVVQGTILLRLSAVLELERVSACHTGAVLPDGVRAPAAGQGEMLAAQQAARRDRLAAQLGRLTPEIALAQIRLALADGEAGREATVEAWHRLTLLLEVQQSHTARVRELAQDPRVTAEEAHVLLAALGAAGHAAAQQALAETLRDLQVDDSRRQSAAAALLQVRVPEATAMAALDAAVGTLGHVDDLVATSLLTFGALAGKSNAPVLAGQTAIAKLLALEAPATAGGHLGLWLEAVGNAGAAVTQPRVLAHAANTDARIRAAVASALRYVGGDAASDGLERLATADPTPMVRVQAVASLARRGVAMRPLLERIATNDADQGVRDEARNLLAGMP